MKQQKTLSEICDDFEAFKLSYNNLYYLMKLFIHSYINITENSNYPDDNEYTAKNCLYSLTEAINEKLDKSIKEIQDLYFTLETNLS